jgi:gluconolactonase
MPIEKLCTGAAWSEGPVWIESQQCVLWSDIPNNRMLRWSETDGMSIWRKNVEFTNGHTLDLNGDLLHCSHGLRAIIRTPLVQGQLIASTEDQIEVSHYLGKRLNSPNDIVVKRDGTIWFTDPPYGIVSNNEGHKAESELTGNFVFCFCPNINNSLVGSGSLTIASDWLVEPNGLAFSPDESILYVSDTSAALGIDGKGNHHIVAFDVLHSKEMLKPYTLENPRIFATISPGLPDGFRVNKHGFIFTSSEDSVQIYNPQGQIVKKIDMPEKVGNLCFGGIDNCDLYITATSSLYRYKLRAGGFL